MLRKTLTTILALGLVAVTVAAASVSAKPGQDRMTICHDPPGNPGGARTMDVSRSAWKAHRDHGDHEGACTQADRARPAAPPQPPQPAAPKTALWLTVDGEGGLDGARFRVVVRNPGHDAPVGVAVDGSLSGQGRWSVEPAEGKSVPCSVDGKRVGCAFGDLPAGQDAAFVLRYDAPSVASVCREAGVDLALSAANDSTAGDDRVKQVVKVGACSPL